MDIKVLTRSYKILEILAIKGGIDIEKIYTDTKIPRASIYRILCTIENMGYISRKNINGLDIWETTLKLLTLTGPMLARFELRVKIRDILENLAEKVNEFIQLGVLHNWKVLYVDLVKRPKELSVYGEVGLELEINLSAAGMVLAAYLNDEDIEYLLSHKNFPKNTIYTVSEPNLLRKELKEIVKQGYAYDDQRYAIGIRCIAVPVFNYNKKVCGAINITGHISSITDESIDALIKEVKVAAKEASIRLGFQF